MSRSFNLLKNRVDERSAVLIASNVGEKFEIELLGGFLRPNFVTAYKNLTVEVKPSPTLDGVALNSRDMPPKWFGYGEQRYHEFLTGGIIASTNSHLREEHLNNEFLYRTHRDHDCIPPSRPV